MEEIEFRDHIPVPASPFLFKQTKTLYKYMPIEENSTPDRDVLPHDRELVAAICEKIISMADDNPTYKSMEDTGDDDEGDDIVKYQIQTVKHDGNDTYHVDFDFPRETFITNEALTEVFALGPNRIMECFSGSRVGRDSRLRYRIVIIAYPRSLGYNRTQILVSRSPLVTYIETPNVGPRDEGLGTKRGPNKESRYHAKRRGGGGGEPESESSEDGSVRATKKRKRE